MKSNCCNYSWCYLVYFRHYLVFRIGGKSADVSILRVDAGLYRIVAYKVESNFGGENFSNIISECLIKEFEKFVETAIWCDTWFYCVRIDTKLLLINNYFLFNRKWNVQVPKDNKRALSKFLKAAEQCKQILSLSSIAKHFIESAYDGIDYQCTISRTKFEMLCSKLLEKCVDLIDNILIEASLTQSDIAKVIENKYVDTKT